jgi:hypothetical protein
LELRVTAEITVHLHNHTADPRAADILAAIGVLQGKVIAMSEVIAQKLAALTTVVTRLGTIEQSVLTFVEGIPALIAEAVTQAEAAGATPEQLASFDTLTQALDDGATQVAAAITANTPAAGTGGTGGTGTGGTGTGTGIPPNPNPNSPPPPAPVAVV